jgi:hypothetical protein
MKKHGLASSLLPAPSSLRKRHDACMAIDAIVTGGQRRRLQEKVSDE